MVVLNPNLGIDYKTIRYISNLFPNTDNSYTVNFYG